MSWSHSVVVITLDFDSSNPSSNLGWTYNNQLRSFSLVVEHRTCNAKVVGSIPIMSKIYGTFGRVVKATAC